jgi:hypothetical protein
VSNLPEVKDRTPEADWVDATIEFFGMKMGQHLYGF